MSKIRTLSLFNNKGGVGKTTLSTNIAHDFAERGHRVFTSTAIRSAMRRSSC